jgi:hypothetical protein
VPYQRRHFRRVAVLDFEYEIADGGLPNVLCLVVYILNSELEHVETIRRSHSYLIKTGMAAAAARGATIGRPATIASDAAKVKAMRVARLAGKSVRAIAVEFGISSGSVQRLTAI